VIYALHPEAALEHQEQITYYEDKSLFGTFLQELNHISL